VYHIMSVYVQQWGNAQIIIGIATDHGFSHRLANVVRLLQLLMASCLSSLILEMLDTSSMSIATF
jgi:Flp pilus assembly CpaE family ATPase